MQDPRSHPGRCETLRVRLRTLVWLSLALSLLLTSCDRGGVYSGDRSDAGGDSGGVGGAPGSGGGPPPTTGDRGVLPPTTVQSSLDRYVALAKRELEQGSTVYNPPEQMRLDERTRIEARVTRHPDSTFTSNLQGKGASRVEQLPVGTKMRGQLLSDDFTITPLRPEVQQLGAKGFRSWVWEIKPSRTGELTLTLELSVVYDEDILDYTSFDRSIKVGVTPSYATTSWLSRNWDKFMRASGVSVAVAVGGILAFFRRRRTPDPGGVDSKRASPLERQRNSH
jgi:hypothetical protein